MRWQTEMLARLTMDRGWHAITVAIHHRRGVLMEHIRAFIDDAFNAAGGRDSIPRMRESYRNIQYSLRQIGDTAMAMRDYHHERGTLTEFSQPPADPPPGPAPDELSGLSLPLLRVNWLKEESLGGEVGAHNASYSATIPTPSQGG